MKKALCLLVLATASGWIGGGIARTSAKTT
jgi:hypothetical protein